MSFFVFKNVETRGIPAEGTKKDALQGAIMANKEQGIVQGVDFGVQQGGKKVEGDFKGGTVDLTPNGAFNKTKTVRENGRSIAVADNTDRIERTKMAIAEVNRQKAAEKEANMNLAKAMEADTKPDQTPQQAIAAEYGNKQEKLQETYENNTQGVQKEHEKIDSDVNGAFSEVLGGYE